MIYHNVAQNSEDWLILKNGKFSASSASDLWMKEDTKGFNEAIIKVAYERVTGLCQESYSNKWMQHGHEFEPLAAENYEIESFNQTEIIGLYEYNSYACASPDRKIVGENAGCEFKCPSFQVYDEYLRTFKIPKSYFWQIHWQLFCTGWDYIDYMPFISPSVKQILIRVDKDQNILNEIAEKLEYCTKLVDNKIKLIQR
jgi:predicted phage-related endonuclease